MSFHSMWTELLPLGRDSASGGYRRYAWTPADTDCRAWFRAQALARGLTHETDRNGNQWAWLGDPAAGNALVTGSHLDSVPDGGAFDGPLGVVSAFAALDELRSRGVPFTRPFGIVNFGDEEGARFGLACVGSRLATGALTVEAAHRLTDAEGITLPRAMEAAGHDPDALGPDPERLGRIGAFVELHVEQGRALDLTGDAVGVASAIWPHGRWRYDFRGEANHAGTTRLADRRDPMPAYAETVLAARREAQRAGAVATFGKVAVEPNGVNAIPSLVRGWLDSRAADQPTLDTVTGALEKAAREYADAHGVELDVVRESFTPVVEFDHGLRDALARILGSGTDLTVPVLGTGAGHDAGILSAAVPTAMLFVRNPTGVSHSPAEYATEDDCTAGVTALADVLEGLIRT
ncbi:MULTISPECIES: allantoate amidohydrolase [Streptomyces]|uniref:Allantoate amidohydrolase n=3 Tax=Streptomyces griseoaurantiacus TaxID=68213 RepID=F3NRV6_9ACTN|nr:MULTISPECIES: allantoate amidohydrolase [Streptomyces]NJP71916.1 allantoate amidohydrolase [Streptomyces sp. C1-2]EGG43529.1 allantoate amidohydrolase [Streptomyces griseoaurantiacus M045]MBA5226218.1 allantoate amidohydrolase [Streptomyces griseoaurantiacus]MDX3360630.1 allantoate amidohydrolase [Streptomyces sp. ME02-6978.2a]WTI27205.1 allantoate amidohydrolase [Streptomyces jietaisiensis]